MRCSLVKNSVEGMNEVLQYRLLRGLSTAGAGGAVAAAGSGAAAAAAAAGEDEPPPWSAHTSTIQDPHSVNPYTTTGFIIWYCFLFLCCGLPIICCCISVCCLAICKRCHPADDGEGEVISGYGIGQEANDLELEIARIEANVHAFSLKEQQSRRSNLENAWIHHKMIVEEENIVTKKVAASATDNCSNLEEIFELQHIPVPGPRPGEKEQRRVPSSCAICLESYRPNDSIVWSTNTNCVHVFHEQCISLWLLKQFKPACPVCRQQFISLSPETLVSNQTEETSEEVETLNVGESVQRPARADFPPESTADTIENNSVSEEAEEGVESNQETQARD